MVKAFTLAPSQARRWWELRREDRRSQAVWVGGRSGLVLLTCSQPRPTLPQSAESISVANPLSPPFPPFSLKQTPRQPEENLCPGWPRGDRCHKTLTYCVPCRGPAATSRTAAPGRSQHTHCSDEKTKAPRSDVTPPRSYSTHRCTHMTLP